VGDGNLGLSFRLKIQISYCGLGVRVRPPVMKVERGGGGASFLQQETVRGGSGHPRLKSHRCRATMVSGTHLMDYWTIESLGLKVGGGGVLGVGLRSYWTS